MFSVQFLKINFFFLDFDILRFLEAILIIYLFMYVILALENFFLKLKRVYVEKKNFFCIFQPNFYFYIFRS